MTSLMYLVEGLHTVMKESFLTREVLAFEGDLVDLIMTGLRYFLETMWKILVPI